MIEPQHTPRFHMDDFLLERIVKNIGNNHITLTPDFKFKEHVERHGKKLISEIVIAPNEQKTISNFYIIITTNDNLPAKIVQYFPQRFDKC